MGRRPLRVFDLTSPLTVHLSDPVWWALGAAVGWSGLPAVAATYGITFPDRNDGQTPMRSGTHIVRGSSGARAEQTGTTRSAIARKCA